MGLPQRRRGGGRRALGAAWQGEKRTRREAKVAVRARARRVDVHSKQEVARGPSFGGGRRGSALAVRGTERQVGGGRQMTSLQFQKFQGLFCKTKITFNLGLDGKVPNVKIAHFFKIYNFDVVQKFI